MPQDATSNPNPPVLTHQVQLIRLREAITEALRKMEAAPGDDVQTIWNESLSSWQTGLHMNHRLEVDPIAA